MLWKSLHHYFFSVYVHSRTIVLARHRILAFIIIIRPIIINAADVATRHMTVKNESQARKKLRD